MNDNGNSSRATCSVGFWSPKKKYIYIYAFCKQTLLIYSLSRWHVLSLDIGILIWRFSYFFSLLLFEVQPLFSCKVLWVTSSNSIEPSYFRPVIFYSSVSGLSCAVTKERTYTFHWSVGYFFQACTLWTLSGRNHIVLQIHRIITILTPENGAQRSRITCGAVKENTKVLSDENWLDGLALRTSALKTEHPGSNPA